MGKRAIGGVLLAAVVATALAVTGGSPAAEADLAGAGPARPGPALLYGSPGTSPLLANRDPAFRAGPLLVSGTEAYDAGEYLYQDHVYDDFGADTGRADPSGPASAGDVPYPNGGRARHGDNAADLVEFRISTRTPDSAAVVYRFTLNTLLVPDSTVATVAFDTDGDPATGGSRLRRDPGQPFPGTDETITAWGTGAEHSRWDAARQAWVTTPLAAGVDLEANQITVTVPRTTSDPAGTWRATLAVGLFEPRSGTWVRPNRTGGIYNLGFRFDEPVSVSPVPPDLAQAAALADRVPTRFAHDIDFDALAARTDRPMTPRRDTQIRIFASRLALGEGRDYSRFPRYLGSLQPYSLTVPSSVEGGQPAPFTLLLHSLTRHHWQYHGTEGLDEIGAGRGSVVVTPLARGIDGWYEGVAEYDVFEAWADAARQVELDPGHVAVVGYSMGGLGAYRLAGLYPDLFGRAATLAAPPGRTGTWLPNVGHIPFFNVAGALDAVVPIAGVRAHMAAFDQLGLRHRYRELADADHTAFPLRQYSVDGLPRFLGESAVVTDPGQVTFVYTPETDDPALGLIHNHAYWVSSLTLGGPGGVGRIDAHSLARPADEEAKENRLVLSLANLGTVRIELAAAGLDTAKPLTVDVTSDSPGTVYLAGAFSPGAVVAGGPRWVRAVVSEGGVSLPAVPGGTIRYTITPPPQL